MSEISKAVIGVDYGTDSVRTVILDAENGREISHAVYAYPRWKRGLFCDPAKNQFRQHPLDYIEGLEITVKKALTEAPAGTAEKVKGLAIDTTGSTPVAVSEEAVPLALLPDFADNPNAMFILWKDHTALREAEEINRLCKTEGNTDYTKYEGGIYSSEWFWAKVLHILRIDPGVRKAAYSWMEHCDWMTALLTGTTAQSMIKHSRCAAGHKAMWHEEWGGLPPEDFLTRLDPLLSGLRGRLFEKTYTCDTPAGKISPEWAGRLGLPSGVVVAVGGIDAHIGAVGGSIGPDTLLKVMGTSTCDMLITGRESGAPIRGICGEVDGSIVPGFIGLEAGQSAFGDVYAWFKKVLLWPVRTILPELGGGTQESRDALAEEIGNRLIAEIEREAEKLPVEVGGTLALDWMNGRRTPDANQMLKGAVAGLSLGTDAPRIYRSLVEATAFGSRAIVERFMEEGVQIREVIALGGVARKSPLVMQIVADVLNMRIKVSASDQACALGAGMFAAVASGLYPRIEEAQERMGAGFEKVYIPRPEEVKAYDALYKRYKRLGAFIEAETRDWS